MRAWVAVEAVKEFIRFDRSIFIISQMSGGRFRVSSGMAGMAGMAGTGKTILHHLANLLTDDIALGIYYYPQQEDKERDYQRRSRTMPPCDTAVRGQHANIGILHLLLLGHERGLYLVKTIL